MKDIVTEASELQVAHEQAPVRNAPFDESELDSMLDLAGELWRLADNDQTAKPIDAVLAVASAREPVIHETQGIAPLPALRAVRAQRRCSALSGCTAVASGSRARSRQVQPIGRSCRRSATRSDDRLSASVL
jgi:hypothetical protein